MGPYQGTEHGPSAFVPSLGSEGEQGTFTHKEHPECRGAMPDSFRAVLHVLDSGYGRTGDVVVHGVQRRTAQGQDALGHRFNVVIEVGTKHSELALKFKELWALDIPLEAACVVMEDLKVTEQGIEFLAQGGGVVGIEAQCEVGVHGVGSVGFGKQDAAGARCPSLHALSGGRISLVRDASDGRLGLLFDPLLGL